MQSVKRTGAQQFEQRTCQTLSTPPHRADASDPLALGRPAFPLSGGSPAALPPPLPADEGSAAFFYFAAHAGYRTSDSAAFIKAGSDAQGARCRRVLEYSRHRGTQRIRFRNFLLAALLYKIEKLGLSMHTDLHIDMSDVGLRRIE